MHVDAHMHALVGYYNWYANDQVTLMTTQVHTEYYLFSVNISVTQSCSCYLILFAKNIMNRVLPSSFFCRATLHLLLH
jgi:hypothetical protein